MVPAHESERTEAFCGPPTDHDVAHLESILQNEMCWTSPAAVVEFERVLDKTSLVEMLAACVDAHPSGCVIRHATGAFYLEYKVMKHNRSLRLYSLVIPPEHRGQGWATAIVMLLESRAKTAGARALIIGPLTNRRFSRHLLDKLGFRVRPLFPIDVWRLYL